MLKKICLAAALPLLMAGFTLSTSGPAQAIKHGCWAAAKAQFPGDRKARKAYRKECRLAVKAQRRGA